MSDASTRTSKEGQRPTKTAAKSSVRAGGRAGEASNPKSKKVSKLLKLGKKKASRLDVPRPAVDQAVMDGTAERKTSGYVDASMRTLEGRQSSNASPPLRFIDPVQQRPALFEALGSTLTSKIDIYSVLRSTITENRHME